MLQFTTIDVVESISLVAVAVTCVGFINFSILFCFLCVCGDGACASSTESAVLSMASLDHASVNHGRGRRHLAQVCYRQVAINPPQALLPYVCACFRCRHSCHGMETLSHRFAAWSCYDGCVLCGGSVSKVTSSMMMNSNHRSGLSTLNSRRWCARDHLHWVSHRTAAVT